MRYPDSVVPLRSPEKEAREFNRLFPIGTRVRYWTGSQEGLGRVSTTRTEAIILGGHTVVVWVHGEPSCIALSHIEPIAEPRWKHTTKADVERIIGEELP